MANPNPTTHKLVSVLPPSKFGRCACPKIQNNIGPSYDDHNGYAGTEHNDEASLSATYDDSDGEITTGENFGCVHFTSLKG